MKLFREMTKAIGPSVFVLLLGCQEDKSIDSPFELLTSKVWKLTAHGVDANENNILDAEEDAIITCQKDNTYVFFSNETGHYSDNAMLCGVENESDFNWKFLNNCTILEIGHEQFSVNRLNKHELILKHRQQAVSFKTFLLYNPLL